MARMALAWIEMLNRSLRWPSQCWAISRCPVLEIGRNSVMPSMMPSSRAASRAFTAGRGWRRAGQDTGARPGFGGGGGSVERRCGRECGWTCRCRGVSYELENKEEDEYDEIE